MWRSLITLLLVIACLGIAARGHGQDDSALPALTELLGQTDDTQFQLDLLKGMAEGLKGRRGVKMPAGWEAVEERLEKSTNAQVRELSQGLSLTFGSKRALAALRSKLTDPSVEMELRQNALQALLAAKDPALVHSLQQLLNDRALRAAALRGLAAYDDPATPAAILKTYPHLSLTEQRDALNTLASRLAYARPLLAAVEQKIIPSRDLTADIVRQLRQFKDDDLQKQIAMLWGVVRESAADKLQEIARHKAILEKPPSGNAFAGRAVFARVCQQCHTLFDIGGKVGPDITGSNRGDLDYLLQNILDPNAVIPNDYRTSTVEVSDDRVLTGIVVKDDPNAVTLNTANEQVVIPRAEIVSLRQGTVSMMPEGLLEALPEKEVRDLVAYLRSPAQVAMEAQAENLSTFFNGKDLTGWDGDTNLWSVMDGEIVGKTSGLKRNEWLTGPLWLSNFRLQLQVRLQPNKENSGIQFRSQRLENSEVKGYQADVGAGWWGKLYEEHGRGLLWDKSGEPHIRINEWNTYEIIAEGSRIRTFINGQPCVDLDDPKGARAGIIGLQLHSGGAMEVRYRNLKLELR